MTAKEAKATRKKTSGLLTWSFTKDDFTVTPGGNFIVKTVTYADGYITIEPAEITVAITGNNDTKTYNGEDQTVEGFDYEVTGAAKTDVTVALNDGKEAKATRKDVGTTNMELTKDDFTVTPGGNFIVKTVTYADGYITIEPAEITVAITGNHDTKTYNGEDQTVEGFDYEVTGAAKTDVTVALNDGKEAKATKGKTSELLTWSFTKDDFTVTLWRQLHREDRHICRRLYHYRTCGDHSSDHRQP